MPAWNVHDRMPLVFLLATDSGPANISSAQFFRRLTTRRRSFGNALCSLSAWRNDHTRLSTHPNSVSIEFCSKTQFSHFVTLGSLWDMAKYWPEPYHPGTLSSQDFELFPILPSPIRSHASFVIYHDFRCRPPARTRQLHC